MCAHYENVCDPRVIREYFKAMPTEAATRTDILPGYVGSFIVRPPDADVGDEAVADRVVMLGVFGLLPHWAKDDKLARLTYNARSETVAKKPSFRDAWQKARHCIIPAQAIYEPDWRSGRAVATRIERSDGQPMGIAGLWDAWHNPEGQWVHSYTMLTLNADAHTFMRQFHKPGEEERMVVILAESDYDAWLRAPAALSKDFIRAYPAEGLRVVGPGSAGFADSLFSD